jgi:hypothetical protein
MAVRKNPQKRSSMENSVFSDQVDDRTIPCLGASAFPRNRPGQHDIELWIRPPRDKSPSQSALIQNSFLSYHIFLSISYPVLSPSFNCHAELRGDSIVYFDPLCPLFEKFMPSLRGCIAHGS